MSAQPHSRRKGLKMKTYVITTVSHDSEWQNPVVFKTNDPEKATEFFHDIILTLIDTLCPALVKNFGSEPTRKNKTKLFAFINEQPRMEIDDTRCILYNNNEKVMDATLYDITDSIKNINGEETESSLSENATEYYEKFYKMQHNFYKNDAKNYTEDLIERCNKYPANNEYIEKLKNLTDEDFNTIATRFADNHDCNIPDNDQWENLIWRYIGRY